LLRNALDAFWQGDELHMAIPAELCSLLPKAFAAQ